MAKVPVVKRTKLLKILQTLGEDSSLEELTYHFQNAVSALEAVQKKMEELSNNPVSKQINSVETQIVKQTDSVGVGISGINEAVSILTKTVVKDLNAVLTGLKPLENFTYLVKISDRLGNVEKLLTAIIKQEDAKDELTTSQMARFMEELKTVFVETANNQIKANKETITVVSGGGLSGGYLANTMRSSSSVVPTLATVDVTASTVVAANSKRKRILFQNTGTTIIKLSLSSTNPTATVYTVALSACSVANDGTGGTYIDDTWQGVVTALSSGAGGTLAITQLI